MSETRVALPRSCSLPVNKLLDGNPVRVPLPPDVDGLQDTGVTQLNRHTFLTEAQGLAVIVRFDTADKMRCSPHHLRQQVHE